MYNTVPQMCGNKVPYEFSAVLLERTLKYNLRIMTTLYQQYKLNSSVSTVTG
jgi:hypothetical protein